MGLRSSLQALAATLALFHATYSGASEPNVDMIERGRYLALAGNCSGCHSRPGQPEYTGGVGIETPYGTVYSTNITQDEATGIGTWSESDFRAALRRGVRPDGQHLYPAFPYTAYTGLSDADVGALYAYFSTVAPAVSPGHKNTLRFPFNFRFLLKLWNWLYLDEQRLEPRRDKSPAWNRGAYLVEALGHCGACHTPRNWLGAQKKARGYTGATYLDRVPGGAKRPWFAVDLTPGPAGLGAWSERQLRDYLKLGLNDYATAFGPMNKVIGNSTRHLVDEDIRAMATYLGALPTTVETAQPNPPLSHEGEQLYAVHCATCHLPTGLGALETGTAIVGNPVVLGRDPASLINAILYGPELPDFPLPVQRTRMDGYQSLLNDSEIAALSTYVRNTWGNRASAVSAAQVARQR